MTPDNIVNRLRKAKTPEEMGSIVAEVMNERDHLFEQVETLKVDLEFERGASGELVRELTTEIEMLREGIAGWEAIGLDQGKTIHSKDAEIAALRLAARSVCENAHEVEGMVGLAFTVAGFLLQELDAQLPPAADAYWKSLGETSAPIGSIREADANPERPPTHVLSRPLLEDPEEPGDEDELGLHGCGHDVRLVEDSPMTSAYALFPQAGAWVVERDGDAAGLALYRRHYSARRYRDGRKPRLFVGPGEKMVLVSLDRAALFVWVKARRMRPESGINCSVFRNEGSQRSSDLIREACELAWNRWPGERLYTYVNSRKIRSTNPGFCFLAAGWHRAGETRGGLVILETFPGEAIGGASSTSSAAADANISSSSPDVLGVDG